MRVVHCLVWMVATVCVASILFRFTTNLVDSEVLRLYHHHGGNLTNNYRRDVTSTSQRGGSESSRTSTNNSQTTLSSEFRFPFGFPARASTTAPTNDTKKHKAPRPVRVLERFIQQHSVESLRQNPHHRKYSIVFYSCPLQAGNRLHHYMNGMLFSILTNRTMLWKYWDKSTCNRFTEVPKIVCRHANTAPNREAQCSSILTRAPWIPSFDEWSQFLNVSSQPYRVPLEALKHPGDNQNDWNQSVVYEDLPVVVFPEIVVKNHFQANPELHGIMIRSNWSQTISEKLHYLGLDFMYGMLLRYSFDFSASIQATVPPKAFEYRQSNGWYTIALHTRHVRNKDDGCDITREKECIQQLELEMESSFREDQNSTKKAVYLMSDRACTLTRMTEWLQNRSIEVLVSSHAVQADYLVEHGPFAGLGYFQDLALASQARSAFVGNTRTSSDLLRELLTFYQKMEAWQSAAAAGGKSALAAHVTTLTDCNLGNGRDPVVERVGASAPIS